MAYAVYMHTCPNGKSYVGITKTPVKRRWHNGGGYISQQYFYRAIQKIRMGQHQTRRFV